MEHVYPECLILTLSYTFQSKTHSQRRIKDSERKKKTEAYGTEEKPT